MPKTFKEIDGFKSSLRFRKMEIENLCKQVVNRVNGSGKCK
jgi:hypothetical protein